MAKKLVTVMWSTTVEVEIPDGIDESILTERPYRMNPQEEEFVVKVLKDAYDNVGWRDGEITDCQDA